MALMGKDIKTKAANEVKTLEPVGEPGKRMKQAYIRAKQRKAGDTSGTSPAPGVVSISGPASDSGGSAALDSAISCSSAAASSGVRRPP